MKRYSFLLLLLCATTTVLRAQQPFNNYLEDGIYIFDDEFKVMRDNLFIQYKSEFGLSPSDEMVLDEEQFIEPTDPENELQSGSTQARYRQYHKGFPVESRQFNVVSKCGVVLMVSGSVIKNMSIDENYVISEANALTAAQSHVNPPGGFVWEDPDYVLNMQMSMRTDYEDDSTGIDTTLTFIPTGELLIAQVNVDNGDNQQYALCWKFNMAYYDAVQPPDTEPPVKNVAVYVDAHTGAIYNSFSTEAHSYFTGGNVWTPYDGNKGIELNTCSWCFNFALVDHRRIQVNDGGNKDKLAMSGNRSWVTSWEKEMASPYWCIERSWDYFLERQGINNGNVIQVVPRSFQANLKGTPYFNPYGSIDQIHVPGNGVRGVGNWAALDVMGHEFTHAKIYRSSRLGYGMSNYSESRALDEGFGDIFGVLIENWNRGWNDWNFGENLGHATFNRSMHSPVIDVPASSNSYFDVNWYNQPPYSMSGPLRKWFTHLSQGEWNWTPAYSGVGLTTAERLAFITMYWWLWQGSDYHHVRSQSLAVADVHFGGICNTVWKKVDRAWADVGITTPLSPCKPWGLRLVKVASPDQLQSVDRPVKMAVRSNLEEGEGSETIQLLSCNWHLPPGWTGTFSPDNTEFVLNGVGNFDSRSVSVDVSYLENGMPQVISLSNVLHFSDECSVGGNAHRMSSYKPAIVENKEVNVYPNPTTGEITLILPGKDENINVQLIDIPGRTLYTGVVHGGINQLTLPVLPNGVYLLKVNGQHLQHTERVTIQR